MARGLQDTLRGQSKDESFDYLARNGNPNILTKRAQLAAEENPAVRDAKEKAIAYDAADKLKAVMRKRGGTEMIDPDDIMFDGGQGPAPEGPLEHNALSGIPELIDLGDQHGPEFRAGLQALLDKINRASPNHRNATVDNMRNHRG